MSEHGVPLRVLFSIRGIWFVRLFESTIRELADRGHAVTILGHQADRLEPDAEWIAAAAQVAAGRQNVTFAPAPRHVDDDWTDLRIMTRLSLDYLRFLGPEYRDATVLEARARGRTPAPIVRFGRSAAGRVRAGRAALTAGLRAVERAMPIDRELLAYLSSVRPDVVLLTPLVTLGSQQQDLLRGARRLGIPSALCVGSWDHLSSKALIRPLPDRVIVWNQRQRAEAVTFHGVPADRVEVTGAPCFDVWFDRRPSRDRASFCARVGLDPAKPYIMYVCSALFEDSPNESAFVLRWIEAIRASGHPRLRDVGLLVRPHPKRAFEWEGVDLSQYPQVTLWPPHAEAPFDLDQKAEYFDSLHHSAAIVGLNTSALIEGGIIGRPVHTILLPEFRDNQEGTLHFHYLLDGLLRATRNLPSHAAQIAASVACDQAELPHNRDFVERFIRPRGLQWAATPAFADAVEQAAGAPCRPQAEALWEAGVRFALRGVARATSGTFAEKLGRERRRAREERAREERLAALRAAREEERALRRREQERQREAQRLAHQQEREARRQQKQAGRQQRLDAKRGVTR
jgi:hypothetical protein